MTHAFEPIEEYYYTWKRRIKDFKEANIEVISKESIKNIIDEFENIIFKKRKNTLDEQSEEYVERTKDELKNRKYKKVFGFYKNWRKVERDLSEGKGGIGIIKIDLLLQQLDNRIKEDREWRKKVGRPKKNNDIIKKNKEIIKNI